MHALIECVRKTHLYRYTPKYTLGYIVHFSYIKWAVHSHNCLTQRNNMCDLQHHSNLNLHTTINSGSYRFGASIYCQWIHTHSDEICIQTNKHTFMESSKQIWDATLFQTYNRHAETDKIMALFYWLCRTQINANSSWHLSERVKDPHISADVYLDGSHYWYVSPQAKDKSHSSLQHPNEQSLEILCME